jgi:hypothetical protein
MADLNASPTRNAAEWRNRLNFGRIVPLSRAKKGLGAKGQGSAPDQVRDWVIEQSPNLYCSVL